MRQAISDHATPGITYTLENINEKETETNLFEELTKPYVIVTFLSVLEMSKNNELMITQDKTFGSITLEMKGSK